LRNAGVSVSRADDLQQRVERFADHSIEFVANLPRSLIAQRMAAQYLDASTSVAANYRAARRGRSHDEFTAKLGIVSEEADECVYWLERFRKARIVDGDLRDRLLAEAQELARIFGASARTARSRRRKRRPGDPPPR
jgi:four helix bundle protein